MSQERKIVRNRIIDILKGKTEAGENVVSWPTSPEWEEDLPAIHVVSRSEILEKFNDSPLEFKRNLNISVECIAASRSDSSLADLLDDMAEKVEEAVMEDDSLGLVDGDRCLVERVLPDSIEFEFEGDGEQGIGAVRLQFNVVYVKAMPRRIEDQARLAVGDLKSIGADWKIGHDNSAPDEVIEAQDEITLSETNP